jgi:hypothetical protein
MDSPGYGGGGRWPEMDSWLDPLPEDPTPEEIFERFSCVPVRSGQVTMMSFEGTPNAHGGGMSGGGGARTPTHPSGRPPVSGVLTPHFEPSPDGRPFKFRASSIGSRSFDCGSKRPFWMDTAVMILDGIVGGRKRDHFSLH